MRTRSLRNEVAQRQGGVVMQEIGSNDLIDAVRRLLDGQRLGLPAADSRGLTPKAIRAIANHTLVQQAAVSVYALEYTLRLNRCALETTVSPSRKATARILIMCLPAIKARQARLIRRLNIWMA